MKRYALALVLLTVGSSAARADEEKEALKRQIAELRAKMARERAEMKQRVSDMGKLLQITREQAEVRARQEVQERDEARKELRRLLRRNADLAQALAREDAEWFRIIQTLGEQARAAYGKRLETRRTIDFAKLVLQRLDKLPEVDATPNGSAEILAAHVFKGVPKRMHDNLRTGDTDKDGKKELLDAWGHPISYLTAGKAAVVVNAQGKQIRVEAATRRPKLAKDEFELVSLGPNGTRDPYGKPGCDDLDTSKPARR